MRELRGNLLNATENIIMHQVNCKGVMGAGVAYQIRRYLLSDYEYERYRDLCKNHTAKELLGKYMVHTTSKDEQGIIDLFGEDTPTKTKVDTDYNALEKALTAAVHDAVDYNLSIALPGYLGCGLAGGDWEIVYNIIRKVEQMYNASISIYYLNSSVKELWKDFGDVPMDPETECIEEGWHGFTAGTHREEIWDWFEETFSLSVAEDLMFSE